tara:strand:- start:7 stop:252 length:246 start_codon:yes stop_codon:yes gene_type:complete
MSDEAVIDIQKENEVIRRDAILLEDTYFSMEGHEYVKDSDYGVGEEFTFIHNERKWAFTIYHHAATLTLTDITEGKKNATL